MYNDLMLMPIDILCSQEEALYSNSFQFMDKIEIKKEQIVDKLKGMLQKIFKDTDFPESSQN